MRITLKLFASLSNYLPPEMAHLVLINGIFVAPSQRGLKRLAEDDHLAMWPPVAGG